MSSKRTAYRLRIIRRSGARSVLGTAYSPRKAYDQALLWRPPADDAERDPVDAIDVMYREPGSVQWRLYEDFWRRDRDPAPTDREVRPTDSFGEGDDAPAPPTR